MKILMANKYYHPAGGPEEVMLMTSEHLQALGHTVIPFSMQHPHNLRSDYESYFVSQVDYNHHSRMPWNLIRSTFRIIFNPEAQRKMKQLIQDVRPDIAHLHNIYHQLSPSILTPLKEHGIPVVMTVHDFKLLCPNYTFMRQEKPCEECRGKHFYKAVKYKCVKKSYFKSAVCALEMYIHTLNRTYKDQVDCFITLSRFTQDRLIRYGVSEEKVRYLPNYVGLPNYKSDGKNQRYVLFLGTLSDKNGAFNLVKAMRHLPSVKVKMAGRGDQEELIRSYIRKNAIDNVQLLGFITGSSLEKLLADCEFLVFPCNCYHNCPMAILQSFAHGKPVVASKLGSVPELVREEVTGFLFEPGDEKRLTEKIELLWKTPKLTRRLGINARQMVEREFSRDRYYPRLLGIYQGLIRNQRAVNSKCLVTDN